MKYIKLFAEFSYDMLDIISMRTETRQNLFDEEIKKEKFDYDLLQMIIDLGEIKLSYFQLLEIDNSQLTSFLLSDTNKELIEFSDIYTKANFPSEYFASVREIDGMVIYERDFKVSRKENNTIFYEFELKKDEMSSESILIPISLDNSYTIYYPERDAILYFEFDIEECFAGSRSKILQHVEDGEYLFMHDLLDTWLTLKLFNVLKSDEKFESNMPKDLKYSESTNSYDLHLKDYEDLADLYPDDEDTIKKIFNGDIYYDYFMSYEKYFFDELDSKTEDLLRSIIIEKNPDVDIDEIDTSRGLEDYISSSDDDVAKKIKECIERAYNITYEGSYQDALRFAVEDSAYSWLTGNSYNKSTSFKYDDGNIIVRDIRLDLVIVSLFYYKNSNFIDCLNFDLLEDDKPEVDLERAEYNVDIDSDWFIENLQECLYEENVLDYDGEIFKNYKSKK